MPKHKNLVMVTGRWKCMFEKKLQASNLLLSYIGINKIQPLSSMFVKTELSENISRRTEA